MKNWIFVLWAIVCGAELIARPFTFKQTPAVNNIRVDGFDLSWEYDLPVNSWITWSTREDFSSKQSVYLKLNDTRYTWSAAGLAPATFVYVIVSAHNEGDTLHSKPLVYTTKSLSSGKIQVYFNHPVTTSVATAEPAVYLNRSVDDTLIAWINRARESIDIAIYNSSSSNELSSIATALNNAYNRGVRVRVVHDASTTNSMVSNLNSSIGRIQSKTGQAYGIMHNKFVVIDAESENPLRPHVWTGSTNWTPAQMNGPDYNNVIIIQDQALARAYQKEFEEMYGSTGNMPNPANAKFGPDKADNTPHEFNIGGKRVRSYFSPTDNTESQLLSVINSADSDLQFASMIITRTNIANAILARNLPDTYGLTDNENASPPAPEVFAILKSGMGNRMIEREGSEVMHHKFLYVDHSNPSSDPQLLTGSHNWSSSANNRNDENTIIVHDHDVVNQFHQAFVWMFNESADIIISNKGPEAESIRLYPNPAFRELFISEGNREALQIEVYSLSGTLVMMRRQSAGEAAQIDVSELPEGMYLLRAIGNQKVLSGRFIKR